MSANRELLASCSICCRLKHKARIPVPLGHTLVGIADEYGIIPEGCVYARIERYGEPTWHLTNRLAVSRSPNLHPGDLQICRGIDDKDLFLAAQGLVYPPNVLVFSVRGPSAWNPPTPSSNSGISGSRSLPSMLAGGDLDGDL